LRVLMNRMYYMERQRIFEFREGFIKAISIVAGSVALAKVANQDVLQFCAAVITLASTISLVFGYGNKARESVKLSTEWANLEHDIDLIGERDFTEDHINIWQARCNEIESGEPPANIGLLEKCYHRAVTTLGGQTDRKQSFWQRYHLPLLVP